MIKIREPAVQPCVSRETPKRWSADDAVTLEAACTTGRLPDGRIATQMRLALFLGFSRQCIVGKLQGRRLPLCNEVMRENARAFNGNGWRSRVAKRVEARKLQGSR